MKKNLSSIVFTILVLLIGGYSLYEYKFATEENPADKNKVKVFAMNLNEVTKIQFQKLNSEPWTLTKKADSWTVTYAKDMEDFADLQAVTSFLAGAGSEKAKIVKKEEGGSTIQWKEYQLDQPMYSLEFEDSKGSKETVMISALQAFDGNFFIKLGNQLVIGEKSWGQYLNRSGESFRDKKLFRDPFEPNQMNISYDEKGLKQKFTLKKEKDVWSISGQATDRYDSAKMAKIVEAIKDLRANGFMTEPASAKDLKSFGLDQISFRIDLAGPNEKTWWLELGREQKDILFARSSAVQGLVILTPSLVESIKLSLEDLRDGRLPFSFDVEQVHRLKVSTDLNKIDIKRSDLTWEQTKPDDKKEVDQTQLTAFFQKIKNLNAKNFLKKEPFATKYKHVIEMLGADNKELLSIRWSDETQEKQGAPKIVFVRTNRSNEVLVVPSMEMAALPIQTLIKAKSHVAETPANPQNQSKDSEKPQGEQKE